MEIRYIRPTMSRRPQGNCCCACSTERQAEKIRLAVRLAREVYETGKRDSHDPQTSGVVWAELEATNTARAEGSTLQCFLTGAHPLAAGELTRRQPVTHTVTSCT